jgi:hypothetical protein
MKMLLSLLFLLLMLSSNSHAKSTALCSYIYSSKVIEKVEKFQNDKLKHCSVTCMLTLRCGPIDALELGMLKEMKDLFGDGNAEWADLEANQTGAYQASIGRARTDKECISRCRDYYPN